MGLDNNERAKIAFFLPGLNDGGAERVFVNLSKAFAQSGYEVEILLLIRQGPYLSEIPSGIKIVELDLRGFKAFWLLMKYVLQHRPRVIISALPAANILASTLRVIFKDVRVVVTEHAFFSVYRRIAYHWKTRMRNRIMRQVLRFSDRYVAVSNGAADDLASETGIPRDQIDVIYNPLDLDDIDVKASEEVGHPWLKNKDIPVILSAGRLQAPKDFSTLFKAVKEISDLRLIILGRGALEGSLKAEVEALGISDRVDFAGFVINPYAYMSKVDIFVLSSHYEGFGYVLVEAMACGTPVLSSDCPGGPTEILEGGVYGTLVPVGDVEAMVQGIRAGLSAPVSSEVLKKRAKDFALEKIVSQYEKIIQECL